MGLGLLTRGLYNEVRALDADSDDRCVKAEAVTVFLAPGTGDGANDAVFEIETDCGKEGEL